MGADYVALSFVRTAADVRAGKAAIARDGKDTPVIAKLEKPEAIDNLEEILAVADGVMVRARRPGCGNEPGKSACRAKSASFPVHAMRSFRVITATQMLDSMQKNPRPTRAEASDVANAIFDGSDALIAFRRDGCRKLSS